MNLSQPPTASTTTPTSTSTQTAQIPPSTTTVPLLKKTSTQPQTQSTTIRPATDHHWYNKQLPAAPYHPQSQNPPPNANPNSTTSLNLQKQFPNQQTTSSQGIMHTVGAGPRNGVVQKSSSVVGGDRSAAYSLHQLGRPDTLSNQQMQFLKSGYFNHSHPVLGGGGSSVLQGFPVNAYPKAGFSAAADRNGNKEARSKDDLAVVRNRKVRVSEGSSLYSLCRSWLKNGFHDQYQPKHPTRYSYLPRPLPTPAQTPSHKSSETKEVEEDAKEDEKSVDHLSSEDLLQMHIKRAKRVRSRLREERLHRITRYKTRLATLLPSPVEPVRDETPAGN